MVRGYGSGGIRMIVPFIVKINQDQLQDKSNLRHRCKKNSPGHTNNSEFFRWFSAAAPASQTSVAGTPAAAFSIAPSSTTSSSFFPTEKQNTKPPVSEQDPPESTTTAVGAVATSITDYFYVQAKPKNSAVGEGGNNLTAPSTPVLNQNDGVENQSGSFLFANPLATQFHHMYNQITGNNDTTADVGCGGTNENQFNDYSSNNQRDYNRDQFFANAGTPLGFVGSPDEAEEEEENEDPNRVPTFVKVRGLPEQQDPRIQKRKKPKNKNAFTACFSKMFN
ncbi:unnamed protein product [Amoebophrya sp. A120]|nr:unnamed protein product [Amoebophrya sp. A120]|eukprot:GSA120T00013256001.1